MRCAVFSFTVIPWLYQRALAINEQEFLSTFVGAPPFTGGCVHSTESAQETVSRLLARQNAATPRA